MKKCPACGRAYYNDSINFCLEDGTVLSEPPGAAETLALPNREQGNLAPTVPAAQPRQTRPSPGETTIPAAVQAPPAYAAREEPRRRSALLWLIPVAAILLIAVAVIAFYPRGEKQGNVDSNSNGGRKAESPTPTPTPEQTPTPPEFGHIRGTMAYPSEGIPGEMVACAENLETKETACTDRRKGWEEEVSYSLKVPPGKYYVYGKLLPGGGDDSPEGMQGVRAYYTEYMKCGMGENCNSHQRVPLDVGAGESLTGITVGDWWANF